jgi:hypothetical protein
MNFSSILDISSFFIGMIINLILVSLMCYYFKRKYEILETAQTEQAKILYQLLRRDSNGRASTFLDTLHEACPVKVDYTQDPLLKKNVIKEDSDSESGSDSDSDSESDVSLSEITLPANPPVSPKLSRPSSPKSEVDCLIESIDLSQPMEWVSKVETKEAPVETQEIKEAKEVNEIKEIVIELDTETNYSKMSIKQLKDILTSKGVKHKNNMKKDELVDLLKDTEGEVTI